jgi:hypothetical protein
MSYVILPRGIEDARDISDKFYQQMCLINMLRGKYRLFPDCIFKKLNLNQIEKDDDLILLPPDYTAEDLELLYLYEIDEIADREKLKYKGILELPVPFISDKNLYLYDQIADRLSTNKAWLEELIRFYDLLTDELIMVDKKGLKPSDFLYEQNGSIKYFIGYSSLTLRADKVGILENNLYSLAHLLYLYYLEDTENRQAKLYQQEWFKRIEGRLIKPLVYGDNSNRLYQNFREIMTDLAGEAKYLFSRKRIGVFLDVANILTPLLVSDDGMVINFDKLLARVYGKIESRKIDKKIAVMFLPSNEGNSCLDNLLSFIENYLKSYGFQVIMVGNETQKAKTLVQGKEIDVDDQKLLEIIGKSRQEMDSILLLTGDKHFFSLVKELQDQGKEIRIISVTGDSTYKGFCNSFNHSFLDQYWDCIEYVAREDVNNGSL